MRPFGRSTSSDIGCGGGNLILYVRSGMMKRVSGNGLVRSRVGDFLVLVSSFRQSYHWVFRWLFESGSSQEAIEPRSEEGSHEEEDVDPHEQALWFCSQLSQSIPEVIRSHPWTSLQES
ncbi:hypothetical protein Tco_1420320 [Tanacetum coccineum]